MTYKKNADVIACLTFLTFLVFALVSIAIGVVFGLAYGCMAMAAFIAFYVVLTVFGLWREKAKEQAVGDDQ